jgi:hypothetical protein
MKTFLTLAALGLFSAAIIGCEVNGKVGDPDRTTTSSRSDDTSYSKKTVVSPDGDRKTTIEEHR